MKQAMRFLYCFKWKVKKAAIFTLFYSNVPTACCQLEWLRDLETKLQVSVPPRVRKIL